MIPLGTTPIIARALLGRLVWSSPAAPLGLRPVWLVGRLGGWVAPVFPGLP